jgi:N-acyl-L-homoserine lactone synthetase
MSICIELAETLQDFDDVFVLRHQVLVAEEGYVSPVRGGRIVDRFDAAPNVVTVLARVDGELVGSIRMMERTADGTSADDYFDFQPHLVGIERVGALSHLVVRQAYRHIPGLTFSMFALCYAWASERGLTHITGAANPVIVSRFIESGWKRLGAVFYDASHSLWVQPILLDMSDLSERFGHSVERHGSRRPLTSELSLYDSPRIERTVA